MPRCRVCLQLSPVSIQTQSLALRALRKRKPQETQALATASTEHSYWLALAFVARNFHATHATQAIAFEWKPGFRRRVVVMNLPYIPAWMSVLPHRHRTHFGDTLLVVTLTTESSERNDRIVDNIVRCRLVIRLVTDIVSECYVNRCRYFRNKCWSSRRAQAARSRGSTARLHMDSGQKSRGRRDGKRTLCPGHNPPGHYSPGHFWFNYCPRFEEITLSITGGILSGGILSGLIWEGILSGGIMSWIRRDMQFLRVVLVLSYFTLA